MSAVCHNYTHTAKLHDRGPKARDPSLSRDQSVNSTVHYRTIISAKWECVDPYTGMHEGSLAERGRSVNIQSLCAGEGGAGIPGGSSGSGSEVPGLLPPQGHGGGLAGGAQQVSSCLAARTVISSRHFLFQEI